MKKAVQTFSEEYLERCRAMSPDDVIEFIDGFRQLHAESPAHSKLISIKIPKPLLTQFRAKCQMEGIRYQTQIKKLMHCWVAGGT
jgi:predicted DNA binding CopG/RHH family protein